MILVTTIENVGVVYTENMTRHDIDNALTNWIARTNLISISSLCDYINGKREKGLSDHYAAQSMFNLKAMINGRNLFS